MHMHRVDTITNGKQKPLTALTVFSIHCTAIPPTNVLYSGDVFAYVERELKWEMQRCGISGFVHVVCNGTHADNAPNIPKSRQGFEEAKHPGILVGQQAIALHKDLNYTTHSNTTLSTITKEIDQYHNPSESVSLCLPKVENTLLVGAKDSGPTPIVSSLPFFKEG